MTPLDLLRGLSHSFTNHRARTVLTLLGIMIGSGSIVTLAGLLRGAEEALVSLNQGVSGSDLLRFYGEEPPAGDLEKATRELSTRDAVALDEAAHLSDVDVGTETSREGKAERDAKQKRVRLTSATPASRALYRLTVEKGRFIDDHDLAQGGRVAVLGNEVWRELFEEAPDVLGQQIVVDGHRWTIVGVLAKKPSLGHGTGTWRWDRRVLVPQRAFDAVFDPTHGITSMTLRVRDGELRTSRVDAVASLAEQLLLRRHLGVKNFRLADRAGKNQERRILDIIHLLLLATSVLSLAVGGINIMNIMLVTVTERTREIGIRRAIGAGPKTILTELVLEAGVLSAVGGLLGVIGGCVLSIIGAWGLEQAFGAWNLHLELWSIAVGVLLALLTGVLFGFLPALRAARLRPIEALRAD